jgi:hypothetical protein
MQYCSKEYRLQRKIYWLNKKIEDMEKGDNMICDKCEKEIKEYEPQSVTWENGKYRHVHSKCPEPATLTTWEMIKALTENPKLKAKSEMGNIIFTKECCDKRYFYCEGELKSQPISQHGSNLPIDGKWTLIQPEPSPVPVLEAAKAYKEGKTITCEWMGRKYTYNPSDSSCFIDNKGTSVCVGEILDGIWHIIN